MYTNPVGDLILCVTTPLSVPRVLSGGLLPVNFTQDAIVCYAVNYAVQLGLLLRKLFRLAYRSLLCGSTRATPYGQRGLRAVG